MDGHITPVASKIYGKVAEVLVDDNQHVKAGQVLARIDARDYQAKVDQAKAARALAEGQAQAGERRRALDAGNYSERHFRRGSAVYRGAGRVRGEARRLTSRPRRRNSPTPAPTWTRARPVPTARRPIWRA